MNQLSRRGSPFANPLVSHGRGILAHFHHFTFRREDQWLQVEQAMKHPCALLKTRSCRGTDLSVRVLTQIFLDQIDQTSLMLQRGQQRDGGVA